MNYAIPCARLPLRVTGPIASGRSRLSAKSDARRIRPANRYPRRRIGSAGKAIARARWSYPGAMSGASESAGRSAPAVGWSWLDSLCIRRRRQQKPKRQEKSPAHYPSPGASILTRLFLGDLRFNFRDLAIATAFRCGIRSIDEKNIALHQVAKLGPEPAAPPQ
jgi:hypothetical protein